MRNIEDLITELEGLFDEQNSDKARELALLFTDLTSRQIAGQDVTMDLQHVRAQIANLAATKITQAQNTFRTWAVALIGEVLEGL